MRLPKVNFSYNLSKGSVVDRLKKTELLNADIFNNILGLYKDTDTVSLRQIEKVYKQSLPEKIDFKIKKLSQDEKEYSGGLLSSFFNDLQVSSYRISLPVENNLFNIIDIPILMHESTHLLDHALNPKINKNLEKTFIYRGLEDDAVDFYSSHLYNPTCFDFISEAKFINIKKQLRNFLSEFSPKDQIVMLNNFRQSLSMEVHAYHEEDKYMSLLCKKKDLKKIYNPLVLIERAMFNLKINLLNNSLKNIIERERNI